MRWRLRPSVVGGRATVPGDKSIAHRALMLGALTGGVSSLHGMPDGQDVGSTASCMAMLGAGVERADGVMTVKGRGALAEPPGDLDAGNSGTTMRLLSGLLAGCEFRSRLVGDESLLRRPMERVIDPLRRMGAEIRSNGGRAPLEIVGRPLHGVNYETPVASAQVKSAVLLAALLAKGQTRVHEPVPSRDHTERMLAALGVPVKRDDGSATFDGPLEAALPPFSLTVPGDASSAAFLAAAAVLTGGEIEIEGVGVNPTRIGFLELLQRAGADVRIEPAGEELGEPVARVSVRGRIERPLSVQPDEVPLLIDELPLLALLATQAPGTSVIRGAGELRVKETDRISAVASELNALGADVREQPDGFDITGPTPLVGATVRCFGDHRIAMMLAVAGTIARGETIVEGAEAAAVSFGQFASTFAGLGARIDVD